MHKVELMHRQPEGHPIVSYVAKGGLGMLHQAGLEPWRWIIPPRNTAAAAGRERG
jgi:hypothetical protein